MGVDARAARACKVCLEAERRNIAERSAVRGDEARPRGNGTRPWSRSADASTRRWAGPPPSCDSRARRGGRHVECTTTPRSKSARAVYRKLNDLIEIAKLFLQYDYEHDSSSDQNHWIARKAPKSAAKNGAGRTPCARPNAANGASGSRANFGKIAPHHGSW